LKLLRIEEAAMLLGIKVSTLRDWVWKSKIEFVKIQGSIRFREDAITTLIENSTKKVPEKVIATELVAIGQNSMLQEAYS
jgi:excisionase family DNA binding protein